VSTNWNTGSGVWGYLYITLAAGTTLAGTDGQWQTGPKYGVTGQTNGMATAGSVFYVYDVGLYLDPQNTGIAPPWVMPAEADEVAACMRYYYKQLRPLRGVGSTASSAGRMAAPHPYPMRITQLCH
jgi:hypothetical protein